MLILATTDGAAASPEMINWLFYLFVLIVAAGFSLGLRRLASLEERHNLQRWVPAAHVTVWTLAASIVVVGVASAGFTSTLVLLILVLVALGAAGLSWLRSVLAGLVLFSEAEISPGDRIQVGDHKGEVVSIGIRSVRIRDVEGAVHDVPHATLLDSPILRFPESGDLTCLLDVELETEDEPTKVLETVRTIVGLAPLASPRRKPEAFFATPPKTGTPLKVSIRAYPCSSEYQDEYRSDVLRRIARRFG